MGTEKGIWVFAECKNGELRDGTLKLVSKARKIANQTKEELSAVILGAIEAEPARLLAQYGANQIISIDHPSLSENSEEINASILADVTRLNSPQIILANDFMNDLFSRLAAELQTGLVTSCDGVDINQGKLAVTKPVYGGRASASYICAQAKPQIATISSDALEAGTPNNTSIVNIVKLKSDVQVSRPKNRKISLIPGDPRTIDIVEADIIVDGGRGLGSKDGFKLIEDLAEAIGGSVAASRMAVDNGWCSVSRQIGITAKIVKPKFVLACGVSGATQHTMGLRGTDVLLAINTDRKAPIFNVADVAVVANALELIPLIISKIRQAPSN